MSTDAQLTVILREMRRQVSVGDAEAAHVRADDLLIDAMHVRNVQILIESHSEYLLRRLQRRLAEEEITPADVGIYFCEARSDASRLVELELDLFGNIQNWPRDFFGDQTGEIAESALAMINRKRSQN